MRVSLRAFLVTGTVSIALAGTLSHAEARGRRRSVALVAPVPSHVTATPAVIPSPATAAPSAVPAETGSAQPAVRPIFPVPAPASGNTAKPIRTAGPWCPNQRVVGTGAGFCEIN